MQNVSRRLFQEIPIGTKIQCSNFKLEKGMSQEKVFFLPFKQTHYIMTHITMDATIAIHIGFQTEAFLICFPFLTWQTKI